MAPLIDIHAHIVPAHFPVAPVACCHHWPSMAHGPGDTADVMIGGRVFRALDNRSWNLPRRAVDMDTQGVAMQALSPMPELLSYWIEADDALELARYVNGTIATMVAAQPSRFAGLGMVPLQDPMLAANELSRIKADGLHGIEIGSNILGISPGDAQFDPFYAEAERLGMAIFVHALHPTFNNRLVGPKPLDAFLGFPTDVGLAAASFITGRTLEKFPGLRVGFSHGGGTFSAILPRLQKGWQIAPPLTQAFTSPTDTARRMFYDNIVFDPSLLRHMVVTFGATQIFAGSDYPYSAGQDFPGAPFDALGLSPETLNLLRSDNARRFLGLDSSRPTRI
jgi:aminocarboxymuconate-semialdehyde decarboxylase